MKRKSKSGGITDIVVDVDAIVEKMRQISELQRELVNLKDGDEYIFQTENFVGESAELRICQKLNLTQEIASNMAYDAVDDEGKTYQIKARWLGNKENTKHTGKNEFGMIDLTALDLIDYVIVVMFNPDFSVNYAYKLDIPTYKSFAYNKKIKNSAGLSLKPSKKCLVQLDNLGCSIKELLE